MERKSEDESWLRESEATHRGIVESIRDCTTVLDLKGKLVQLPGRSRELLHLGAGDDWIGVSWIDLWDPADRDAARQAIAAAAAGDTASFIGLMSLVGESSIWWDVLTTPVRDVEGNILRVLAVARDITDRRRAEMHAACLASISRDILMVRNPSEVLGVASKRLAVQLGVDRCALLGVEDAGGRIEVIQQWRRDDTGAPGDCPVMEICRTETFRNAGRAGEALAISDTGTETRFAAGKLAAAGIRSLLLVPLHQSGNWTHSLCVHRASPHSWRPDETDLVRETCSRLVTHLERVRSEEILSRLAAIVEHSGDAIVSKDLNGYITSWNKGAESLFGYTAAEVVGKSITLLLPPGMEGEEETVLETVKSGQSIRNHETIRLTKDGRLIDISLTVSPVINSCGEIIGASKFARDISQRKRAEKELVESEERFRAMVNAIVQLAWMADPDGYIFWYNRSWYEYTGTTPEEMAGWRWESVHDPAELPRVLETWKKSIALGEICEMTFPIRGADGKFRQFLTRCIPLKNAEGKVIRWFGTNTDIDEIARAEKALRESHDRTTLAHRATGVGIWEWHISSNRIHWDSEMFRIYGIPATADGWVPYSTWKDATHPEDLARQEAALSDTLAGNSHGKRQFRIRRQSDGEIRHIETVDIVRFNEVGEPESVVGTTLDVTIRKQVEEKLMERTAQLVQADRSKDEFLAMLAHELRNPLAPMRNATEILRNDATPADLRRQAQDLIARQIGNLNRIIDDLLDVSRITEGKIVLHRKTVALSEIFDAVSQVARLDCVAHGQELVVSLPDTPMWVDADTTRLEQVIGNLLGNASKYSGDGTRIKLTAAEEIPGELTIRVADNGAGIDPEFLPQIFDLFVQSSRSLDRSHGGLGIGLTVVQRLVRLHGGTIEAHSAGSGQGTEFVIRLPLVEPPVELVPEEKPANQAGPLRILIVDDNVDAAETMAMLQQLHGHRTQVVHNGPDALECVTDFLPQAVLLDIGLPDMDGYEVATRIREIPALKSTFLVALTGYGTVNDRDRALAAGFDKHLTKPADLGVLKQWLDAL